MLQKWLKQKQSQIQPQPQQHNFLMNIITTYGTPKYFLRDRDTHFIKYTVVRKTYKKLRIT